MLNGAKVSLRRLTGDDAPAFFEYWNSWEMRQHLASPFPSSLAEVEKLIQAKEDAFSDRSGFYFGIQENATGKLIGIATLGSVSWMSRHAWVDDLAIFDPSSRGRGYGKEALLLLLDYAFNIIDLHVVVLLVDSINEGARRLYEGVGFKPGGVMRELAFRNGKRLDVETMDMLQSEFRELHGIFPK